MRAVLFDLDNTLFDRDQTFLAWAQWFVRERLGVQAEPGRRELVDLLVQMDANGYGSRAEMFQAVKRRHPALAETVEQLVAAFYREHLSYLSLSPDTQRLLDALDAAELPFGIITNGSPTQLLKLRQLGLEGRTACIYISELVGVRKPAPAIFLAAARSLGIAPPAILFVGDNPEADIRGAAGVGMRTAWLHRGRSWPADLAATPPDYVIGSLTDLLWVARQ